MTSYISFRRLTAS